MTENNSIWCNKTIPEYLKEHFYRTFNKDIVDNAKCCRKTSECDGNHRMDGIHMIEDPPDEISYSYHLSWFIHWENDEQ